MSNAHAIESSLKCTNSCGMQAESLDNTQIITRTASRLAEEGHKWTYYNILRALEEECLFFQDPCRAY